MYVGIDLYLPGINFDGRIPEYSVTRNERALRSITPNDHAAENPAYDVEFSKRYLSMHDANRARDALYKDSSLFKSDALQEIMAKDYDGMRALSKYLDIDPSTNFRRLDLNEGSIKEIWADFANNDVYKAMAEKGGTQSQDDVDILLAAAESYHWEKRYKDAGIYDQSMFDFTDTIKKNTGVALVSNGSAQNITKTLGGSLVQVDDYMLQTMAQHQDHMDIWENVVNGTYSSYDDITKAVNATDDEALKADWKIACWVGNIKEEDSDKIYNKYAYVSRHNIDSDYDSKATGATAKDFWDEFNYNTHKTDSYSSSRSYMSFWDNSVKHQYIPGYMLDPAEKKSGVKLHFIVDDSGNEYDPDTGKLYKTKQQIDEEFEQANKPKFQDPIDEKIEMLRKKMKEVMKRLTALNIYSSGSEESKKQADMYKRQINSYQGQINALEESKIEKQKLHIFGS